MASDVDPFNLVRFVEAQTPVYETVTAELARGEKRSHWMWFVFPQLRGLGHSATADLYAISGKNEGHAYLAHSLLGPRLLECTHLVLAAEGKSARQIFGFPDVLKFHSSMTLFASLAGGGAFSQSIAKFYGGLPDARTLELLQGAS